MLGPLDRAGRIIKASPRFQLTDLIGLMVMLQVGLAATAPLMANEEVKLSSWFFVLVVIVPITSLWAASVNVVSRAGIVRPLRRIAVMLVLIPATSIVMIALPVCIVALGTAAMKAGRSHAEGWSAEVVVPCLVVLLLTPVVPGIRWLSHWVLTTPAEPLKSP
jgi:hypothetical protein